MKNASNEYCKNDLFKYYQSVRLEKAKQLNDINLSNLEPKNPAKPSFFDKARKNLSNIVHHYDKKQDVISEQVNNFYIKNSNGKNINFTIAQKLSNELFDDETYGLSKLLFAVSIILDDEYKYYYNEEGLMEVSSSLFSDNKAIIKIKNSLESHYKKIANQGLSNTQKGVLIGAAALSLVGIALLPTLIGGGVAASAATTTALVAAHGIGDLQIGLGLISLETFIFCAAFTGAAFGGMKLYNSEKVRQEFKNLSPEKNALNLAIQCVYIETIRNKMPFDKFNDILDNILKNLNVLKGDLDYFLFIERESNDINKKKLSNFHEFDKELIKILNI